MANRVLVAGGAGFLGYHLCKRLLQDGCIVTCLDNFSSSSRNTIKDLCEHANFTLLEHDIEDKIPFEPKQFDQIYNLACPASPPHYQRDPVKTMRTAFIGMMNLLEYAKEAGATILQCSTSECYGDPKEHPQRESYWGNVNCFGPRACYDEGKRAGEALCYEYHHQYGVNVRVIRIFNTYGPKMHPYDGRVVSNFIRQALAGTPITLYGSGEQTRSFQYCDDLVEGMCRMMNNTTGFTGPVNLGNPNEFTVRQLAELVLELTKSKSTITYKDAVKDDPAVRQPVIDLARANLGGWEPKTQLREGLLKTIEYFAHVDMTSFEDHLSSHLAKAQ